MATDHADSALCSPILRAIILWGAAVVNILACVRLVLQQQRHEKLPGFAAFVIGTTSVWIAVPAIMTAFTPASRASGLSPKHLWLRRVVLLLCPLEALVSLVAWYHWVTFLGMCDIIGATSLMWLFLLNGVIKGGWAAYSTASLFYITFVLAIAEQSLEQYQPWPHMAFRVVAMTSGISGLNSGLCIPTLPHLICVALVAVAFSAVYIVLEPRLVGDCTGKACLQILPYLAGTVRCCGMALLYLLCMWLLLPQAAEEFQSSDDSGSESDEESTMSSSAGQWLNLKD